MNQELWDKAVAFHGHSCPGLAIGVRASEIAMEKLGIGFSDYAKVVCVTEFISCGVDGVQVLTGCSTGKGNLVYRGTGKQALSFFGRERGKKIRLVLKPFSGEMNQEERRKYILSAPADEVFSIGEPKFPMPEENRFFSSIVCELCGEAASEQKIRMQEGNKVCLDCFKPYDKGW